MKDVKLAVVIPTRNRAEMAITAIRSLRDQPGCDLQIFVSDNSSAEEDVRLLAEFCRKLDDPRVTYMRTAGNLPQGTSWDSAVRKALERSDATHVTLHYDRKFTRPGEAAAWIAVATRFPHKVFTYVTESITAEPAPLRLWQPPWTGKLYAVSTSRVVKLSARGEALELGHVLPVLSNCIVPRSVVDAIVQRFGTLCESTTADSCFAYRFCALYDDFLHLDRPLSILYGSHRSAGFGYLSGADGGDFADYRATWRGDSWLDAAPVPGVNLGYNMLFHEYELVRRAVGGDRLPPLDRAGCLRDLGRGLYWIRDPEHKAELRKLLEENGWNGDLPALTLGERCTTRLRRAYNRCLQRMTLFLAKYFNVSPASISGFQFTSDSHALQYALICPSKPASSGAHLAIVEPLEVDSPLP